MGVRWLWFAFALVNLSGCYSNPNVNLAVPPSPPAPSQEEILARVNDILNRAKAVERAADEAVKLDGSDEASRVFREVRACREKTQIQSCTELEAQAEGQSKVGAQGGFADWLVDFIAGVPPAEATSRIYGDLVEGGNLVVGGDGVVGSAPPQIEPRVARAEDLVKQATAAAQFVADARAARQAEADACMAAAKECDAN